jgi:UDP-N-acetylglucosamine 1-carboxyvinyltransferase
MKQHAYIIKGGRPISGEITCHGAKNFATKAMVASLLSKGLTRLTNVPPIGDIEITRQMLESIGVRFTWKSPSELHIDPSQLNSYEVELPHSRSNRIPILLLSALLQRFEKVRVPVLGGCSIGLRGVDFHVEAIRNFGAEVRENENGFEAIRQGPLRGTKITLPYPSVGATESFLYLSVLAEGTSVISNAAIEPEIIELITMLRSMGAIIYTGSGREFRVEGVAELSGCNMHILGDRIEAASWASLACASDGEITVRGAKPESLGNFLSYYRQVGGGFDLLDQRTIKFYKAKPLVPAVVETDVFPGFSTDWQQPFAILLTQANGISVVHDTVYENRFGYLKALSRLGAQVQTTTHCLGELPCRFKGMNHHHSAVINGPAKLHSNNIHIEIPDLRAGLAYVIAAAIAEGTTILTGIDNIERGYGNIIPRLSKINLEIQKKFM